jgi:heme exporter protein B
MSPLTALFLRDIRLAIRVGGGAGIGLLFFLIVVVLTPFAIGPEQALLARFAPGILWLGALLASILALDRLFALDHDDGSLDLILMAETPLELAVAAKALAHWLTTGLPLVIATPLFGLLMNLDARASAAVALTLLAGTPALTFIGLIGAALSVALRRGRIAACRAGAAADDTGADFRRRRLQRRHRRTAAVRHAVHDPVRAHLDQPGGRHLRRRHGLAAWNGVTPHCAQHRYITK